MKKSKILDNWTVSDYHKRVNDVACNYLDLFPKGDFQNICNLSNLTKNILTAMCLLPNKFEDIEVSHTIDNSFNIRGTDKKNNIKFDITIDCVPDGKQI